MKRVGPYVIFGLFIASLLTSEGFGQSLIESKKKYYDEVYHTALANKDSLQLAEAYYLYGKYHQTLGEYKQAATYLHKALAIHEKHPPSFEHGRVYMWLSLINYYTGNYPLSIKYARSSKDIFRLANSQKGLDIIKGHITSLRTSGMPISDNDLKYFSYLATSDIIPEAKPLNEAYNDSSLMAYGFFKKNDFRKAAELYGRCADYFNSTEDYHAGLNYRMSEVECLLYDGNLTESNQLLQRIERELDAYDKKDLALRIHLLTCKILLAQKQGNWQQAFELLRIQDGYLEKQSKANEAGAISELNIAYETEKKDQEIIVQTSELKKRNNILVALLLFLLLIAFVGYFYYRLYLKNKRLQEYNFHLLKEQNHRVKNNLQMIGSLLNLQSRRLKNEDVKKVVEESKLRIDAMALLQRMLYEDNDKTTVAVDTYLRKITEGVLKAYSCHDEKVAVTYELAELALSPENISALGILLTELVTNACKYAFYGKESGNLNVILKETGKDAFLFSVSDNGKGFDYEQADKNSFGLRLIEIQAGQLNADFTFRNENGCTFELIATLNML